MIGDEKEGLIPGNPPEPTLVSYMRDVHYTGDAFIEGFFQMYNWRALKPDGTLVNYFEPYNNVRFDYYFLWGEEPPMTIPKFDGKRVVLLGPPSSDKINIKKNFNARRQFPFMDAELKILENLSFMEVHTYLNELKKRANEEEGNPFISKERQDRETAEMLYGVQTGDSQTIVKENDKKNGINNRKCANCGFDNKLTDNFCGECGNKLV